MYSVRGATARGHRREKRKDSPRGLGTFSIKFAMCESVRYRSRGTRGRHAAQRAVFKAIPSPPQRDHQ